MTDDDLDRLLRSAQGDEVPLSEDLRARILTGIPPRPQPVRPMRSWWASWIGLPGAAVLGLWLGAVQPAVVQNMLPASGDAALLDEVFGTAWSEGASE